MWGISYGGFTAIQVAKLRPPHLRAILPMYATDDRYRDDVHIRGGCVTASEKSQYAVSQLGMNAMPPYPPFRGEGWREEWRARLEATPPWLMAWIREQTDGPYWRRGSLAPDYEALECAVFQVAGWTRRVRRPRVPDPGAVHERRGPDARRQLGPLVPRRRLPGAEPRLDARARPVLRPLPEGHRQRLGGRARADLVRARVRRAGAVPAAWPGRWRAAAAFPVPGTEARTFQLAGGTGGSAGCRGRRRRRRRGRRRSRTARRPAPAARSRGAPAGTPTASPATSRPDEARGPTWTSEPLGAPLSVIGVPVAVLHLTASMPVATCVVRLSEVAPRRDLVARRDRRAEPHPSAVGHGPLADADPRPRDRGGPDPAADDGLPVPGRRTAAAHRAHLAVAGRCGHRRSRASSASTPAPATPSRLELPVLPDTAPSLEPPAFRTAPVVHARGRLVRGGPARVADRGGRDPRHDDRDDLRRRGRAPRRTARGCTPRSGWC